MACHGKGSAWPRVGAKRPPGGAVRRCPAWRRAKGMVNEQDHFWPSANSRQVQPGRLAEILSLISCGGSVVWAL